MCIIPIRHNPIHYYIAKKPNSSHSYLTDSCLWINFNKYLCNHSLGKNIWFIYYPFVKHRVLYKWSCSLILLHILIFLNVTEIDWQCYFRKNVEIYVPCAIIKYSCYGAEWRKKIQLDSYVESEHSIRLFNAYSYQQNKDDYLDKSYRKSYISW